MKKIISFLFVLLLFTLVGCDSNYSRPEIKDVVDNYGNTVVLINSKTSQGSGVVVDKSGKIITNWHVIDDMDYGTVKHLDGGYFPIKALLSKDESNDLALIKIDANNLSVVKFGNYSDLSVGEVVVAIGNPFGLENTVTEGIISSLDREINGTKLIQISNPISPGNSGGGLFNLNGELIGITTLALNEEGAQNLNFAVPINHVKALLNYTSLIQQFESFDNVNQDIFIENQEIVKKNPFFPFLDNIIIRLIFFIFIAFLTWLICWMFFKSSIQKDVSPIIAFSGWGATWMILVIISAFLIFADLAYASNYPVIESFKHIPILYYIITLTLIVLVIILIKKTKNK